jgi:hypothetical protein
MAGSAFSGPPAPVPYLNTGSVRGPFVENTHTPILAPAPSVAPGMMYMPTTMVNPNDVTDMQAAPSLTPIPTFPPMGASIQPPGPTVPGPRIRPAYPQQVQQPTLAYSSPPAMGMDPTAPISSNEKPIAPPPMTGFVRK